MVATPQNLDEKVSDVLCRADDFLKNVERVSDTCS